jgi:hypothetical protein
VVGCTTGSRREVLGKEKPVIREEVIMMMMMVVITAATTTTTVQLTSSLLLSNLVPKYKLSNFQELYMYKIQRTFICFQFWA